MSAVRVTNADRVMWPRTGFTKGAMLDYYAAVAPALLPHLAGRPLSLGRFPEGVDGPAFLQNECRGAPDWVSTHPLRLRDGKVRNYCVIDDLRALRWVVNLNTVELHPYLFDARRSEDPTAVVFDLDPAPGRGRADGCRLALALREELQRRGLEAWPKTSGGLGMHVYVPLNSPHDFATTRAFARGVGETLADRFPARVDWLQNHPRRSTVAPYSLRGMALPFVSTPLRWEEVREGADGEPLDFLPGDVLARVQRHGDLFAPVLERRQALP